MLKARNYRSNIRRCPLINCSYRNFRLDNLKKHLKSNRHKISNENVVNRIFEMVRSNSLPVDTLLRVQNDNIVHVTIGPRMGLPDSQLESTMTNSITLPVPVVSQEQTARDFNDNRDSSATQTSHNDNVMVDEGELRHQRQSYDSETPEQPPQTSRPAFTCEIDSMPGAVEALNAAIRKININERDMKALLKQTKSVLESKLSEIDQRLEKADTISSNADSTTRSLVELQRTYT